MRRSRVVEAYLGRQFKHLSAHGLVQRRILLTNSGHTLRMKEYDDGMQSSADKATDRQCAHIDDAVHALQCDGCVRRAGETAQRKVARIV